LKAGFVKENRTTLEYFKMVLFPLPANGMARGFFSNIHREGLVEFLGKGVKSSLLL